MRETTNESQIEPLKGTLNNNNNNNMLYNNIFHDITSILYKILIIFTFKFLHEQKLHIKQEFIISLFKNSFHIF